MKKDIKGEKENKEDEPKLVMLSGHAKTLMPFELFMKKIFKTPLRFPNYGSNLYFELHSDNKVYRNRTIDNYYIEYYFDNELLMRIPFSQFKNLVEEHIWSHYRIINYCQVPLNKKFLICLIVGALILSSIIVLGNEAIGLLFFISKNSFFSSADSGALYKQ